MKISLMMLVLLAYKLGNHLQKMFMFDAIISVEGGEGSGVSCFLRNIHLNYIVV